MGIYLLRLSLMVFLISSFVHVRPLPAAAQECSTTITFGSVFQCTIEAAGEIDEFTFTATANDKIALVINRTSGTLNPEFVVAYASTNATVCATFGNVLARTFNCSLPFDGSYTIRVFDAYGQSDIGTYRLFLERILNPGMAVSLSYGDTLTGSVEAGYEVNMFTFSGKANDRAIIRISRTAGLLDPEFIAFDPRGGVACTGYGSRTAQSFGCLLPYDGTYTIILFEAFEQADTGTYNIYLQRLNDPGQTPAISFGQTLQASISAGGELDTFTFEGKPDDRIRVRMERVNGLIEPEIRVYDPTGQQVCNAFGNQVAEISDCKLAYAGVHTILAYEAYGQYDTGVYTMYLGCLITACGSAVVRPCEVSPTTGLDECQSVFLPLVLGVQQ